MSEDDTEIARKALKRIEADATRTGARHALSEAYPEAGILREEHSGPSFRRYVHEMFNWPGADRTDAAVEIVKRATLGHLINSYHDKHGRKALIELYDALTERPRNKEARRQTDRILAVFGSAGGLDASGGGPQKTWLVPARFTFWGPANLTVTLTSEGKVHLKINNQATDRFLVETAQSGLPIKVFGPGVSLPPEKWVRVKLYDEGGVVVQRPALHLLEMGKNCTRATWDKVFTVGALAAAFLPGGVAGGAGGIFMRGVPRIAERTVEGLARAIPASQAVVTEAKGWILKNYGDKGRRFLEVWDRFVFIASVYGWAKLAATALGRRLVEAWKPIRAESRALSGTDRTMFDTLDTSMNRLTAKTRKAEQSLRADRPTRTSELARTTTRRDTVQEGFSTTLPRPPAGGPPRPPSGTPPLRHDTIPDGSSTTLPRPSVGRPPSTPRHPSATAPPLTDDQVSLLGPDLSRQAARFGLQGEVLDAYVQDLQIQALARRGLSRRRAESYALVQPEVRQAMAEHLAKSIVIGTGLSRNLAAYGFTPQDIATHIGTLQRQGRSIEQITAGLRHELKLMNVLVDRHCGGQIGEARAILRATESVPAALKHVIADELRRDWVQRYPNRAPGSRNFRRFSREAERRFRALDQQLRTGQVPEASLLRLRQNEMHQGETPSRERSFERSLATAIDRQNARSERQASERAEQLRKRVRTDARTA